jgi:hypothetical protein
VRLRKFRVAWSVAWVIVTILLAVLWFRSYYYFDDELKYVDFRNRGWYLDSLHGGITFVTSLHDPQDPGKWRQYGAWETGPLDFGRFATSHSTSFRIPYWFACTTAATCALFPWCFQRFSLRTLLITTTLIAFLLGFITWLH